MHFENMHATRGHGTNSRLPRWTESRPCPAAAALDDAPGNCVVDTGILYRVNALEEHFKNVDCEHALISQLVSVSEQLNTTVLALLSKMDSLCAETAPPVAAPVSVKSHRWRGKRDNRRVSENISCSGITKRSPGGCGDSEVASESA